MKTLPLIALLFLTAVFSSTVRAEDAAQTKPAKADCSCCSTDKDGNKTCTCTNCCAGTKSAAPEKVMPKSSYNRKS
ncbi:MAG TPA: hypothetical protein VL357_13570 [Rariglobus sp.]|jgi:hypothetical protein|nr:hypothetical protein [Rariglobus sp.]